MFYMYLQTCTARYIMKYLTSLATQNTDSLQMTAADSIELKILDSNPILEAFGKSTSPS